MIFSELSRSTPYFCYCILSLRYIRALYGRTMGPALAKGLIGGLTRCQTRPLMEESVVPAARHEALHDLRRWVRWWGSALEMGALPAAALLPNKAD